jgi:pyridoxal phosphate enzyme (YggS family)|tara:strand:- start:4307 stop:4924 length:618 start_codon:yes stop_codon:yes gene_type:complete
MDIEKNLSTISKKLSNYNAKLIPVIKNRTVEEVKEVYNCGFREFGENRLDDYFLHSDKFDDAVFHFIAPIQSRKIKVIFENFEFIHTVSRFKEIDLISKLDKKRKVLLQINIDKDLNKSGIDPDLIFEYFEYSKNSIDLPIGLMCIPNIQSDPRVVFSKMQSINAELKKKYSEYVGELSMGMSDDYEIALDYGATIIRVGSKIFT